MYTYIYIYIYAHTYIHTCIHTYIHTYICDIQHQAYPDNFYICQYDYPCSRSRRSVACNRSCSPMVTSKGSFTIAVIVMVICFCVVIGLVVASGNESSILTIINVVMKCRACYHCLYVGSFILLFRCLWNTVGSVVQFCWPKEMFKQ